MAKSKSKSKPGTLLAGRTANTALYQGMPPSAGKMVGGKSGFEKAGQSKNVRSQPGVNMLKK